MSEQAREGTTLYFRAIEESVYDDPKRGELMREVWQHTPWMIDVYTGSISNSGRYREIMDWCREQFGNESWPLHGMIGNWHSGGATVYGYTWMGFSTEEIMNQFIMRWCSGSKLVVKSTTNQNANPAAPDG